MLIISCAYAHDSLRLIPMRIHADIIRLRSLYHVLTHMISLRLIPMRIRADIIRLRSLYHVLTRIQLDLFMPPH